MTTSNDIIGFVGIGAMGTPMATNLARAGYRLVVFDLDAARTEKLAQAHGAMVAMDLADLGAAADIVITMLPDGKAVRHCAVTTIRLKTASSNAPGKTRW